jgi:hypothetical protein
MVSVLTRTEISIVCIGRDRTAPAEACAEALARRGLGGEVIHDNELLSGLRSCRGTYIAFWPTDGVLDPDALESALAAFDEHPHAGAVCGPGFLVDPNGKPVGRADIVTLLFTSCQPFLPAGVFRRQALEACGLAADDWQDGSVELDLCHRIASDFGLHNIDDRIALGTTADLPADPARAIDARMDLLSRLFSDQGFWGADKGLMLEAQANMLGALGQQLATAGVPATSNPASVRLQAVARDFDALLRVDHRALRSLHRLFCTRSHNLSLFEGPLQRILARSLGFDDRLQLHVAYQFWNATFGLGHLLKRKVIAETLPASEFHPAAPSRAAMLADLYGRVGVRYETRGQIELALEMWEQARPPDNIIYDSLATQARLRLPLGTDEMIAEHQRLWVKRHIKQHAPVILPSKRAARGGRIRVGYHCAFMDLDTIRYMMRNVMKAHDRSRFEVFAYSPRPLPADLVPCLDVIRDTSARTTQSPGPGTPAISDEQFISLVRGDEIDVFVEMTGFSPGNRFRAMSERVAPVQVSFLNHTGSSHVPNVDYIITDEICTPSSTNVQAHYSEKLAYLPGCFFCFDYRGSQAPEPGEPPSALSGRSTFGCFGYGGKLNHELIGIWARLLERCPDASLYLRNPQFASADSRRLISSQFAAHGIAADRLILGPGVDRKSLLREFARIDVSLDTWPYCGGNTVAEALWMGVPVVSLCGTRFSSRYGSSLLTAAGCSDLVARTSEEYIDIAARLAYDLPRLRSLRRNLRQMSITHGLADSRRFAGKLEAAYSAMVANAERR